LAETFRHSRQHVCRERATKNRRFPVIYSIIAILIVLWVVANIASYTLGGLIHILLVVAVIVFIFNLISGRRR
jgi:hypothetical protein